VEFHDLRTRVSGRQRFMNVHVLVPGELSVKAGHDILERIEADLRRTLPTLVVTTHLEPAEDEASFAHEGLVQDSEAGRRPGWKRPGAASFLAGTLLLVAGGAGSMLLTGYWADAALALSLLGLALSLGGQRRLDRTPN
jgi:hypothetical protein